MRHVSHKGIWSAVRKLLSAPFTFVMIVPILILDVFLETYHQVVFRLLRIPRVTRSNYIRIDRHKLMYLSLPQKIACLYCGYANGVFHYAVRIAGDTETYWCGIMHEQKREGTFKTPTHHTTFLPYGDEEAYERLIAQAKR